MGLNYLANVALYLTPSDSYQSELNKQLDEMDFETEYVLPMNETDEFKGF